MIKWALITLLAASFTTAWRIVIRKAKSNGNDIAFTIIADITGALTILAFLLFFDLNFTANLNTWLLLILSGCIVALSDFLLVYSTKHANMADVSIMMPLSNVFILISSGIFLDEDITLQKSMSVFLIILGSIICLYKGKKLCINKGVLAAIFYGIVVSINFTIDKGISDRFPLPIYGALIYSISALFLFLILLRNKIKTIRNEIKLQKKIPFYVGIIWGLFSLTILVAYTYGEASQVIPFMRIFIVAITLYSIFVLKERERLYQKLAGAFLVTIGAIVLAYS